MEFKRIRDAEDLMRLINGMTLDRAFALTKAHGRALRVCKLDGVARQVVVPHRDEVIDVVVTGGTVTSVCWVSGTQRRRNRGR